MLFIKITLSLLIVSAVHCKNNFILNKFHEDTTVNKTTCMKTIVSVNFPCGTLLTLVNPKEDKLILSLNKERVCYSFIVRPYKENALHISVPVYIMRIEDINQFAKNIMMIASELFWNPRGRFIIELETATQDVKEILEILMNYKVYDVMVISSSNNDIVINTYDPFKGNNCGKKIDEVTVGKCIDVAESVSFRKKKISLKNCTLKVAAAEEIPSVILNSQQFTDDGKTLVGLEQLVLNAIADKANIKLDYLALKRDARFGVILENNTATGLLAVLQNRDADIACGGLVLMRNRVRLFDYMWGYLFAEYKVLSPIHDKPIWKHIYDEFSGQIWMLIASAYILMVAISMIRQTLLKKSKIQTCMALTLWGYLFLNTCSKLGKEKRMRMILFFWIWFTFFVNNFYNTELYCLITGRQNINRQLKPDNLRNLPYEPCLTASTRTFFLFAYNYSLPPQSKFIPECEVAETSLDYVAREKTAFAMEMQYLYRLHEYKYIDVNGNPMLDDWLFMINNVQVTFFGRGFPLRDKFQMYAMAIFESGIVTKHLDRIARLYSHVLQPRKKVNFEKLRLGDLKVHFYIILLGYAVSMLFFVLEILYNKYMKR